VSVSAPAYPLRPRPPAVGVKPFSIAAAWVTPTGLIRAAISCLTDTAAAAAAATAGSNDAQQQQQQQQQQRGHSAWVSETWLVTLSVQTAPGSVTTHHQQQQEEVLQVLDCQLLLVSRAPPAAAAAAAAGDKLLLVSEPGLEEHELPAGETHSSSG